MRSLLSTGVKLEIGIRIETHVKQFFRGTGVLLAPLS